MRIFYSYIIALIITWGLIFAVSNLQANEPHIKYIPNYGQWKKNINYRADIKAGTVFLENNAITFDLFDRGFLERLHAGDTVISLNDLTMKKHAYRMKFVNANDNLNCSSSLPSLEYYNYFLGNDHSKWVSGIHAYGHIRYNNIYDGISMDIYSEKGNLKYDFIIEPEHDPSIIKIKYEGLDGIETGDDGILIELTSLGTIIEQRPVAFQVIDGKKKNVPCEYKLKGTKVTFYFPDGYDKNQELIIDPTLIFSTFTGSYANNFGYTAAFDKYGFLYSGSSAFGQGYPTTTGAYMENFSGSQSGNTVDVALSKFDTTGTVMKWSTYLGGHNDELPHSLIVNNDDELFVFGTTSSLDFPVTVNAYDTSFNGGTALNLANGLGINYNNGTDIFVSRLNASGEQLLASTYIGGSGNDGINNTGNNVNNAGPLRYNYADEVRGEVMLQGSNVYIATCTRSTDFPIIGNVFQQVYGGGNLEGCIIKLPNDLSAITWSSFLGADGDDAIYSIAVDGNNDIYVAGGTTSDSFFVSSTSVLDTVFTGVRSDGFITHISQDGSAIQQSSYWGSDKYDQVYFVELDRYNNVYLLGQTEVTDSTFIYNAAYSSPTSGQFISKITPTLDSLIWSTVFGSGSGQPNISPTAFLVDLCNKIYLSGWGGSVNNLSFLNNNAGWTNGMDITFDAYQSTTDGSDFYLMVLEDDASNIVYGSYMGGPVSHEHVDGGTSRFDRKGKIYEAVCAGCGYYSDFPTYAPNPGPVSDVNNSSCNLAVFKFDFNLPIITADFIIPPFGCEQYVIPFYDNSLTQGYTEYHWYFGDGDSSALANPTHTYANTGTYTITLIITDTSTCNLADTTVQTITIIGDSTYYLADENVCPGDSVPVGISNVDSLNYQWTPSTWLSSDTISNPIAFPDSDITYTLLVSNGICVDTFIQNIFVYSVEIFAGNDTVVCSNSQPFYINSNSNGTATNFIWSSDNSFGDTLNTSVLDSSMVVNPSTLLYAQNYFYIMGINQYGCEVIDSLLIEISDYSIQADSDQWICYGDTIQLHAFSTVQGDSLTFQWFPASLIIGTTDSSAITVSPENTSQYWVIVTSSLGCTKEDTITVTVSQLKDNTVYATSDEDTIYLGSSTVLHAYPNQNYSYQWEPAEGLNDPNSANPIASPQETTEYYVTVTDPSNPNCFYVDTVRVVVIEIICGKPDIFVPNAFTPNDDGKNDLLRVRGNYINDLYFAVYDRWGEMVFETKDQKQGWDGTFKGEKSDPAVFVYYLKVGCVNNEEYFEKGNVTLIR